MENMSCIKNKIDSLTLKINTNQEEQNMEFDSLYSAIKILENKIPITSVKVNKKKSTK